MRIHALSTEECVDFLRDRSLGRLACSHLDQPYIVPIHFAFEPERRRIYAFSSVGQKVEWMRQNPAVCVEVDDIKDKDHWTTVLVFGRYRELRASSRKNAEERRVSRTTAAETPGMVASRCGEGRRLRTPRRRPVRHRRRPVHRTTGGRGPV